MREKLQKYLEHSEKDTKVPHCVLFFFLFILFIIVTFVEKLEQNE